VANCLREILLKYDRKEKLEGGGLKQEVKESSDAENETIYEQDQSASKTKMLEKIEEAISPIKTTPISVISKSEVPSGFITFDGKFNVEQVKFGPDEIIGKVIDKLKKRLQTKQEEQSFSKFLIAYTKKNREETTKTRFGNRPIEFQKTDIKSSL